MSFKPKSFSLRTYSAVLFACVVIAVSFTISVIAGDQAAKAVKANVGESLSKTAYHMADRMDTFMWARSGELYTLSQLDALHGLEHTEIAPLLNGLKDNFPTFSWIGVTDASGIVRAATDDILVGGDISQRPVFTEGKKGQFIGDVHEAVLLKSLLPNPTGEDMKFVDISVPLYDDQGAFLGVLAAHLSWAWANEVQQSILAPFSDEHQLELFVISSKDNVILLGPREKIGETYALGVTDFSKAPQGSLESTEAGQRYLTSYALADGHMDYPGLGWVVVARQPLDKAYQEVYQIKNRILQVGTFAAAAFSAFAFFLSAHIARPLKVLARATERLRFGEAVQIPDHRGVKETEILTESLQMLIQNLASATTELDTLSDKAHHDALTHLPNRHGLKRFFETPGLKSREAHYAVLCLDLDGFKGINDKYGHAAGDQVLIIVAQRLRQAIRSGELVARIGGDEFTVLLIQENDEALYPQTVAQRIIATISEPITYEGHLLKVGCSIGGTILRRDETFDEASRRADEALYASKNAGKNRYTYAK